MNLRDIIRTTIDETAGAVDVHDIARTVAAKVDDPRDALAQTLPYFVREVIISGRLKTTPAADHERADAHAIDVGGGGTTSEQAAPTRPTRSRKVAAIREAWRARLDERYATAEGYKRVGDMTLTDLTGLARVNREMAAANAAKAAAWEKLAAALAEHGAATVGDLADDTLRSYFDEAA